MIWVLSLDTQRLRPGSDTSAEMLRWQKAEGLHRCGERFCRGERHMRRRRKRLCPACGVCENNQLIALCITPERSIEIG